MRKIILFAIFAISAMIAMAQTNPKPGYVITNNGDTIRGVIDFRTNEKLSKHCDFWANGGAVKTTYKPGDIEGFRFENNGKFFVTRRLNVTGEPELYFAEFMVQGKMNLYCVTHNFDEFYFFEREDGEMAELTNRVANYQGDAKAALQQVKDDVQEKREQYGKVKSLLLKSWKAVEGMDDNNMSRKKLINVVREYHNDVCIDGGKCMVYEYKENSDKILHFKAFAGYAYYSTEKTDNQYFKEENYPGNTYEIGLGVEMDLERIIKGFRAELGLAFTPKYESSHDFNTGWRYKEYTFNYYTEYTYTKYEKRIFNLSVGAIKCFGNGKIQPFIRGGGFVVRHSGVKEEYRVKTKRSDIILQDEIEHASWPSRMQHIGAYLGVGIQMAINKQFVRLHGDLHKAFTNEGDMMKWGITAEFGF